MADSGRHIRRPLRMFQHSKGHILYSDQPPSEQKRISPTTPKTQPSELSPTLNQHGLVYYSPFHTTQPINSKQHCNKQYTVPMPTNARPPTVTYLSSPTWCILHTLQETTTNPMFKNLFLFPTSQPLPSRHANGIQNLAST
jgi:hypothetical protein